MNEVLDAAEELLSETTAETTVVTDEAGNIIEEITTVPGSAETLAPQVSEVAQNAEELINAVSTGNVTRDVIKDFFIGLWDYLPTVLIALAVFLIGRIIIGHMTKAARKAFVNKNISKYGQDFLLVVIKIVLYFLLLCVVMTILGIPVASMIIGSSAVILAAALSVGKAVEGTLSDIVGGLTIMFAKPFERGDYIKAGEIEGVTGKIGLVYTEILMGPNKALVSVPNSKLASSTLINYTREGTRLIDHVFDVAYDTDTKAARKVILNVIADHDLVLHDREEWVRVKELSDSSIRIGIRAWASEENYWTVYYDLLEQIKDALINAGINIPFPQMTISYLNKE